MRAVNVFAAISIVRIRMIWADNMRIPSSTTRSVVCVVAGCTLGSALPPEAGPGLAEAGTLASTKPNSGVSGLASARPLHQPLVARWAQCHIQPGDQGQGTAGNIHRDTGQTSVTSVTRHPLPSVWRVTWLWYVTSRDIVWSEVNSEVSLYTRMLIRERLLAPITKCLIITDQRCTIFNSSRA